MSVFTNPADGAEEQAAAYVEALLSLLGDRDPESILPELPGTLEELFAGLDDQVVRRPEAPGKWSMVEVLAHLADGELVWAYRLRMALAEERPVIAGYDQDAWVERLGYRDADVGVTLSRLAALRADNLRLLAAFDEEARRRVVVHRERGEESVARMVELYAGHDLVHRRQLERIRAAVAPAGSGKGRADEPGPLVISEPTVVPAAGEPPKRIEEYAGLASDGGDSVSVARMKSPPGWREPGQVADFREVTLVLAGSLRVEHEGGAVDVGAGQAVIAEPGRWVRYSTPGPEGAEYVAVCAPAFAPGRVRRDEE